MSQSHMIGSRGIPWSFVASNVGVVRPRVPAALASEVVMLLLAAAMGVGTL